MDLRQLKKEVEALPSIEGSLQKFQENWIKPVHSNTNRNLPFLQNLEPETKKELNQKLATIQEQVNFLKNAQQLQEKLRFALRQITELKLTTLNGNQIKAKTIINNLLNDEFFNLKKIILESCILEKNIQEMQVNYDGLDQLLQKRLSLEESIFFMELPHKSCLYNLLKTAQQQKTIIRKLGRYFLDLVKETQSK